MSIRKVSYMHSDTDPAAPRRVRGPFADLLQGVPGDPLQPRLNGRHSARRGGSGSRRPGIKRARWGRPTRSSGARSSRSTGDKTRGRSVRSPAPAGRGPGRDSTGRRCGCWCWAPTARRRRRPRRRSWGCCRSSSPTRARWSSRWARTAQVVALLRDGRHGHSRGHGHDLGRAAGRLDDGDRRGGTVRFQRDQMVFHHIAQGRAADRDWMATF